MSNPYAAGGMAAFQMWSGVQQAQMMKKQGILNEKIAQMNAKYTEKDAWEAELYGYTLSARYKTQEDQVIGGQVAGFEAQGVNSGEGTASELVEETRTNAFLNTLDIQKQARRKALGLKFDASNIRLGGSAQVAQASANSTAVQRSSMIKGASTVAGYFLEESD